MHSSLRLLAAGLTLGLSACVVHTPPGTSVEVALAKKPELVKLPTPPPLPPSAYPAVEPPLPDSTTEKVADAFTRGNFCMRTGNDAEAIAAFEEVVAIDPSFTEAWQNLAILHEQTGNSKKAMEAFRRSKKVAKQ